MKGRICAGFLFLCVLSAAHDQAEGKPPINSVRPHEVFLTDAQITGTYQAGRWGTLEVAVLPTGKVRVYLIALVGLNRPGGPNSGEVDTVLLLDKNMAVYALPTKEGDGRIILHFALGYVDVTQLGRDYNVGFGMGVEASGRYKKTSSKNPHLGAAPKPDAF